MRVFEDYRLETMSASEVVERIVHHDHGAKREVVERIVQRDDGAKREVERIVRLVVGSVLGARKRV